MPIEGVAYVERITGISVERMTDKGRAHDGHKDGGRSELLSNTGVNLAESVFQYANPVVDTRNDCGSRGGCLVSRAPKAPERGDRRRNACQ